MIDCDSLHEHFDFDMSASSKFPLPPIRDLSTETHPESLIQYPCDFPIKVMGACVEGFAEAMTDLVQQFDPGFQPATIEKRTSKAGNYLSLTLTIRATSRAQLDNVYLALTAHPMVKVAL